MRRSIILFILLLNFGFSANVLVPAVNSNMEGVLVDLSCEFVPGQGRVLVTTDPYIGIGAQESERTATEVVKTMLGEFPDKDVIFVFSAENTDTIDGGSAGMAMAICLMSEINNESLASGVSMTGSINSEGEAVQVSGILQKARAVSTFAKVFLIPAGQNKVLTYTKEYISPSEGIYIEEARPLEIDVAEYALENWNLSVIEVTTVSEAYEWMTKEVSAREIPELELPTFNRNLTRMNRLAEKSIQRAEDLVGDLDSNNSIASTYLTRAIETPADFPYTRANYAFLAAVASQTSIESVEVVALEMVKQFQNFETSDPYWRAEMELRISWSLFRENSFIAKKDWLLIAANMFSMEKIGNETLDMTQVRKMANSKILEAKTSVEAAKVLSGESSNAEESLLLAIESFEEELYFAALYNAIDAIAWSEASKGVSYEYLQQLFKTPKEDEFSEAYRRHALYLFTQTEDSSLIDAAIFSAIRADLREGIFETTTNLPINFKLPTLDWKLLTIIILTIYVLRKMRGKKGRKKVALTEDELLMLAEGKGKAVQFLQEKLKKKEITRETYVKLVRELEGF
ncbi:MAG: hypothetical protein GOV00_00865 [Candidatus Altiarchaeota archaeon]|nr:hypothetical protein [Candidatus Altiarchaeota archaeon]